MTIADLSFYLQVSIGMDPAKATLAPWFVEGASRAGHYTFYNPMSTS